MESSRPLLLLLLLAACSWVSAKERGTTADDNFNPETTLLSHFNFVRPKSWQWTSTKPNGEDIVTAINFSCGDPAESRTVALLNHYKPHAERGERESTVRRWKTWFSEFVESAPIQTVTIGTNKVTFLQYTGTYHGPVKAGKKPQLHSNYTFVGAIVEDVDGNIAGRLWGPTRSVDQNKAEFKKMLETALKQD